MAKPKLTPEAQARLLRDFEALPCSPVKKSNHCRGVNRRGTMELARFYGVSHVYVYRLAGRTDRRAR